MGTVHRHLAKVTFNSIPEVVHELGYKIQLQGRVVGPFFFLEVFQATS